MPLFVCDRCENVDNTAMSGFWADKRTNKRKLCTRCRTDTWHEKFDEIKRDEYVNKYGEVGFYGER